MVDLHHPRIASESKPDPQAFDKAIVHKILLYAKLTPSLDHNENLRRTQLLVQERPDILAMYDQISKEVIKELYPYSDSYQSEKLRTLGHVAGGSKFTPMVSKDGNFEPFARRLSKEKRSPRPRAAAHTDDMKMLTGSLPTIFPSVKERPSMKLTSA